MGIDHNSKALRENSLSEVMLTDHELALINAIHELFSHNKPFSLQMAYISTKMLLRLAKSTFPLKTHGQSFILLGECF